MSFGRPDKITRLLDYEAGPSQEIDSFFQFPVKIQRLDLLKSWARGNKFYKLKDFLGYAIANNVTTLVSKGGMFSNHLDAFVSACHTFDLQCKCILRSYAPDENNPSVQRWTSQNADLIYLEPDAYNCFDEKSSSAMFPDALFIPEGGGGHYGIKGAASMWNDLDQKEVTHIAIAGGSMTTAIGLLSAIPDHIKLIIVPAWKNCNQAYIDNVLKKYHIAPSGSPELWNDFHFGGFGKFTDVLIDFMHRFTGATNIPLDPVYTGKMMYAIDEKIKSAYFKQTDRILAIHTGGLQGVEGFAYRYPDQWASYMELIRKVNVD